MEPNTWEAGKLLQTLVRLFEAEGNSLDAHFIKCCSHTIAQSNYDNWNGGTYYFTITLHTTPVTYSEIRPVLAEKEKLYLDRMVELLRGTEVEILSQVLILPSIDLEAGKPVGQLVKPTFWKERHFKLFISHTSDIKIHASAIQQHLLQWGISAFVAHEDIEPTKEWLTEIDIALQSMDALLALVTPNFRDSNWTSQEVGIAIGRNLLVVPAMLGLEPFGFMGRYQGFRAATQTPAEIAFAVKSILVKNPQTALTMANVLSDLLENSWSWEMARALMASIETSPALNAGHAKQMLKALEVNEKVQEASNVPGKITALAQKFGVVTK